ncbi:hypothetical protein [Enterobacter vonholyi]
MTANKPMTGEQLDELMTVAVNMQRESEKSDDRPSAMFAYAVQVAVLELRKVRDAAAALAEENAGLKDAISCHAAGFTVCEACGEENISGNDDVCRALDETPATDASLAEVRAEHLKIYADSIAARMKDKSLSMRQKERLNFAWAEAKAYIAELHNAQLRKGVQS